MPIESEEIGYIPVKNTLDRHHRPSTFWLWSCRHRSLYTLCGSLFSTTRQMRLNNNSKGMWYIRKGVFQPPSVHSPSPHYSSRGARDLPRSASILWIRKGLSRLCHYSGTLLMANFKMLYRRGVEAIVISRVRCIRSLFIYKLSLTGISGISLDFYMGALNPCWFTCRLLHCTFSHQILRSKAHFQQHISLSLFSRIVFI